MHPTTERPQRKEPFGSPFVITLAVIGGYDVEESLRIVGPEVIIGRGEDADLMLSDPEVSKKHFAVQVSGTVYTLVDLGSKNGTYVNAKRVGEGAREKLKHQDEITIGETRILFTAIRFRALK